MGRKYLYLSFGGSWGVGILLALYEDEQEKLYQHIKSVIPEGRMPVSLFF
jgi:hypothetical protein